MVAEAETRRSPTLGQIREWLTLIGAVVVVLGFEGEEITNSQVC